MSNYPPGVSGNEPQITGEWPCVLCDGAGYDEDEDGKHACPHCKGTGMDPEDFDLEYVESLLGTGASAAVVESVVEVTRGCVFDRGLPRDRRFMRAVWKLRNESG